MAITKIEFGSLADPEIINNNFEYLDEKVTDTSSKIYTNNSNLESMVSSQISTLLLQVTSKIEALYPVGSVYIGTTDKCPVASLFGTWEKVAEGLCLQGAKANQIPGATVEAGLPDIQSTFQADMNSANGAIKLGSTVLAELSDYHDGGGVGHLYNATFRASYSNSTYGKSSTVQPPAYLVNIWRRTA